jgi:hypothetical protein
MEIFYLAKQLYKSGTDGKVVREVLEMVIKNAIPPLSYEESQGIIDRAIFYGSEKERNISKEFRDWIEVSEGLIKVSEYTKESQIVSKQDRHAVILEAKRLRDQGIIEKYGNERGVYRKIQTDVQKMEWENCEDTIIDVKWPFELEQYYLCLPKNIIIVGGSYEAGKTAFCLNFAMLNMDKHKINYFSSEMGPLELKVRLKKFGIPFNKWKVVEFIERNSNFADIIDSDGINIVDYIDVPEEAWKIATPINQIFRKLNKGICLIALQKPTGRDVARGGEATLDRSRLYLSMGSGVIKIVKCKNWANDEKNPNNLSREYKIIQGCKFIYQSEWSIPWSEITK